MEKYPKMLNIYKRDHSTGRILTDKYSCPEFEYLKDNQWMLAEKIHGTNVRIMYADGAVTIAGKRAQSQLYPKLSQALHVTYLPMLDRFVKMFGDDAGVCLYCEGFGPGINKGGVYRPDLGAILLDVKWNNSWATRAKCEEIAEALDMPITDIYCNGTLQEALSMVRDGLRSVWGDFYAEGIVARPVLELKDRYASPIRAKIKHRDFFRVM